MSLRKENSMMKRSDFAQKLLDDLRLRKERLAVSQNSGTANPLAAADKYAFSNGGFKGSKEIKTTSTSFQGLNTHNRYSGGNKSLTKLEASNQIVPFQGGRSSEKIDLSKVLAFALENAGKATRMDPSGSASIIKFLHQIGRRSMDYGRRERGGGLGMHQPSSSQLPMIHVHIKEISKGTQKLNQIIKACSNGLGFGNGRSSIEYGKELMQGAIELEQSLRMLVDIQEASEYMTKSQRKNQIKLLDGDDEDDDDAAVKRSEQMQLELPRFSFDRLARADIKKKLSAPAYPEDDNINRRQSPTISRASSHRRSVSYSPGEVDLSRFTEESKLSSSSKPGDKRIPNVIAKLMGIGEFPGEEDKKHKEQKESNLKTKIENGVSITSAMPGDAKTEPRSKDVDIAFQNTRQRVTQANKIAALENIVAIQAVKKLTSENTNSNLALHNETQVKNAMKDKMKSQNNIWEKEREQDDEDDRRSNNAVKGEAKELSYKNESQRMSPIDRRPRPTDEFQKEKKYKPSAPLMENNHRASKQLPRSQQKRPNDLSFEQPIKNEKSESREAKHQREEEKKNNEKEKLQRGRWKANVSAANHLPKPMTSMDERKKLSLTKKATAHRKNSPEVDVALHIKSSPGGNHKSKPSDEIFSNSPANRKDLNPKSSKNVSSPPDRETKLKDGESAPAFKKKSVHLQAAQKVKEGKVHKSDIHEKVNQAMAKQNGSMAKLTRPMKNQNSISKEETDRRQEKLSCYSDTKLMMSNKTKGAESSCNKCKISVHNIQSSNTIAAQETTIKDDPPLLIPKENGSQILKEVSSQPLANNHQEIVLTGGNDQQAPESIPDGNEAHKTSKAVPKTSKGTRGDKKACPPTLEQPKKHPKREIPETLSESDICLKKVLVKSQLFLDTAEALFRLNIPLGVLHANENDCNLEDSNLVLDCGYEIMKRKGRRQELSIHPFMKAGIGSPRVKSLDNLIKQLSKAFEKLRTCGRDGCAEPLVEDYLPKILERDVHYNDPDLNSMWDMGWSDSMLAFIEKDDVVRDMERYVLNGLVEEITRDLICI